MSAFDRPHEPDAFLSAGDYRRLLATAVPVVRVFGPAEVLTRHQRFIARLRRRPLPDQGAVVMVVDPGSQPDVWATLVGDPVVRWEGEPARWYDLMATSDGILAQSGGWALRWTAVSSSHRVEPVTLTLVGSRDLGHELDLARATTAVVISEAALADARGRILDVVGGLVIPLP